MLSETDAFPDMTPADQRHTPVVIGDHFSDIDEDDRESEAASQSSYIDFDDEANSRTGDASVAHAMCDVVAVEMTADVAAPIGDTGDTFGAATTRLVIPGQHRRAKRPRGQVCVRNGQAVANHPFHPTN